MNESYTPTIISMDEKTAERRIHIHVLEQAGYRVLETASEAEALSFMRQQPALVIFNSEDDDRFRTFANGAPTLMWMNGPQGCEFVNKVYLDFLGVRDVDVRGFDWASYVHPDDRKGYVTAYLEAVVDRRLFEATFRFRRHDGQYRWMKSVGTPRFAADGTFLGYVGSTIDVTDVHRSPDSKQPAPVSPGRSYRYIFEKLAAIPPALLTAGVFAIAALLRIALTPLFGSGYTFITFYPATMFSTVIAGWQYGLATVAASAAPSVMLFISPFSNVEHAVALSVFLAVDGLMIVIADSTGRARRQSEIAAALALAQKQGLRDEIEARKRVEEARRESEERLQAILDRAPAAIFIKDAEGRHLFMNEHCAKVLGVDARAANGKTEYELFPRDLADQFRANDAKVWTSGKLSVLEEHIPSVEGLRTYLSQKFLLQDPQGAPYALCGIATDITERKCWEEQLRASEERFALAHQATGIGTFEWHPDSGQVIWNRAHYELFGIDPSRPCHFELWRDAVHPDDLAATLQAVQSILDRGKGVMNAEYRITRPGGGIRWMQGLGRLYPASEQGPKRVVGICMDITERKQAEKQLRESEERLRLAQQAAHVGTFEWNIQTGVNVWTPELEALYGLAPGDFGRTQHAWEQLVHPDDRLNALRLIEQAFETGQPIQGEWRTVWPDGSVHWLAGRWQVFKDPEGTPLRMTGVNFDITERKLAEAALRMAAERAEMAQEAAGATLYEFWPQTGAVTRNVSLRPVLGYEPDELEPTAGGWKALVHPDDVEVVFGQAERAIQNDTGWSMEYRVRHKDGHYIWVFDRAQILRDKAGQVERVVGMVIDITERKLAEQALRESKEQLSRELEATRSLQAVSTALFDSDDGAAIYERVLDTAVSIMRSRYASIQLWDQSRDELNLLGYRGFSPGAAAFWEWVRPASSSTCGVALRTCERVLVTDVTQCEWMAGGEDLATYLGTGIRAVQTTPLVTHDGRLLGMLSTHWGKPHQPTPEELQRLDILARMAADVLARRRSDAALREAQERLQRWNVELEQVVQLKTAELVQSQDRLRAMAAELNLSEQRERKRLATELHDHLQQMLIVGKLAIGQSKRAVQGVPACETALKKVDDVLSDALSYSRTLVAELSPPVLRDHGLAASLKWLAEYMKNKHDHRVTVVVPDDEDLSLPEDQKILLFQSARELLINSSKHAGTGQATLTLEPRDGQLQIEVRDGGVGFDLAAAAAAGTPGGGISSKFGLFSIQERMRALGGSFTIQSAVGEGTTATLVLPLPLVGGTAARPEHAGLRTESTGQAVSQHSVLGTQSAALQKNALIPVLLVDDHAMVRQGLRSVLDAYEDLHVVGEGRDGVEAVKLVEELRPQVVVMDINMPRMTGVEATAHIKATWPETIIVGISVNSEDDNSHAMKRAGAVIVLPKDKAVNDLYAVIRRETACRGQGETG